MIRPLGQADREFGRLAIVNRPVLFLDLDGTLAPLVDRPDRLSAWPGQQLPVADVLPCGARTDRPYDEADHVVCA